MDRITTERITEMLTEINDYMADHQGEDDAENHYADVVCGWPEYDGAATETARREDDAAYVLTDGTVIRYDEPARVFTADRED
jgi:hypothetical protein